MANRLLGLGEIANGARLHSACAGVTEADNLDSVGATPEHFLRRVRSQPGDQTRDLAGANVERRDNRGAPRRQRFHLRCQPVWEVVHSEPPLALAFFAFNASSRASAAASDSCTMTRPGVRRSTATMSREVSLSLRLRA